MYWNTRCTQKPDMGSNINLISYACKCPCYDTFFLPEILFFLDFTLLPMDHSCQ